MINMACSTILCVDDISENLFTYEVLFNKLNNVTLLSANSGQLALKIALRENIDLILLDIMMPEMDGYEVADMIRSNSITSNIPIIFVTAKNDEDSIENAFEHGGSDYVTKPIRERELLSRVQLQLDIINKNRKLKEKEILLLEQSKLAQMGEMLNMIAHQWRQPLNAISASAINLSLQNNLGTLEKDKINELSLSIQNQAQKMSKIISDFMEFNKSEQNKEFFLLDAIEKVKDIVLGQLINQSITLEVNVDKNLKVFHNSKAIEHVLLNLINNARDALEAKKESENKRIKIYTIESDMFIKLIVEDDAGGIPEDIIGKVFNPYFTTKEQGKGTGIGLYMSKQMVESLEESSLSVGNGEHGAQFIIEFAVMNK